MCKLTQRAMFGNAVHQTLTLHHLYSELPQESPVSRPYEIVNYLHNGRILQKIQFNRIRC